MAPAIAPKAAVRDVNGGALAWQDQHYHVPWLAVTADDVDAVLAGT